MLQGLVEVYVKEYAKGKSSAVSVILYLRSAVGMFYESQNLVSKHDHWIVMTMVCLNSCLVDLTVAAYGVYFATTSQS
jgi:hypothetical protein